MSAVCIDIPKSNSDEAAIVRVNEVAPLLDNAPPAQTLEWAVNEFGASLTLATGFGAEGVALIDMSARLNLNVDIFFLDTAFLFRETYELRRRLEDRYGIAIRSYQTTLTPEEQELSFGPRLWATDPDLCCRLRKLEPLRQALRNRCAWITAIRRDQTIERSTARVVEWDYQWKLVKINPLVRWSKSEVWEYISRNNVPYNPLHDQGYPSIGCTHCTRAIGNSEHERAGRWPGRGKRECGIHSRPQSTRS